jgi:hypothetical protein
VTRVIGGNSRICCSLQSHRAAMGRLCKSVQREIYRGETTTGCRCKCKGAAHLDCKPRALWVTWVHLHGPTNARLVGSSIGSIGRSICSIHSSIHSSGMVFILVVFIVVVVFVVVFAVWYPWASEVWLRARTHAVRRKKVGNTRQ